MDKSEILLREKANLSEKLESMTLRTFKKYG